MSDDPACAPGGWCHVCNEVEDEPMRSKQVWYLAHPVTGDIESNLANAVAWIKWLTLNVPERIYIAPWVAEVTAFQGAGEDIDAGFYDRVLADDCEVVRRCDGVLLVGGKVSRGMDLEMRAAEAAGLEVSDWSGRRKPPEPGGASRALAELLLSGYHDS